MAGARTRPGQKPVATFKGARKLNVYAIAARAFAARLIGAGAS